MLPYGAVKWIEIAFTGVYCFFHKGSALHSLLFVQEETTGCLCQHMLSVILAPGAAPAVHSPVELLEGRKKYD